MASENYQEACKIFKKALEIEPGNDKLIFTIMKKLARAHFSFNRYQEAFKYFSHALEIEEKDAGCLLNRAEAHFKLNEFADCIIDCEESLKMRASHNVNDLIKTAGPTKEISRQSNSTEAKKVFYKLSLIYHADKHPNATA